jgi:phospholipid/cholesterol/gamma-HCH transport system substrate-binding protein
MERDANYTAVGAFVLLVVAMAGLFVYWYSEGRDRRDYERYEIYFPGSVTGLSEGSSVRYLGVEVGKVRRIRLDARSPERVQVIVDIDEHTPVSDTTAANLSMLSFATGLLYIDLRENTEQKDMLESVPSDEYPVINTQRSGFDAFLGSLPELAGSVAELLESAKQILSPDNTRRLSEMVANLHALSVSFPKTMGRADVLLDDLTQTSTEIRRLATSLGGTGDEIGAEVSALAQRLTRAAGHLEEASAGVQKFMDENRSGVTEFTQHGLQQMQRSLEAVEEAAREIGELAGSLKENPSQLIYQSAPGGVEVPR